MPAKSSRARTEQPQNIEQLMGNKPPQAIDVEEAVLGAMLVEPSVVDEAMEELTAPCFYDSHNRAIFEAMAELVNEHVSIDLITVSNKMKAKGTLEEVGGPVVLARLSQNIGAAAHIEYYIRILKQKTIQRDLIKASYDILKQAFDESSNVDLIDNAQSKVFSAIQNNVKRDVQDIGSIINSVLDNLQELQGITGPSGVPSGYPSVDRVTQGWQKSDLIILAARPSVGKTAFALNIARNAAVDANMPVAVFSLEMSADQLGKRLITTESGLSGEKIKGGTKLEEYEWVQLENTLRNLAKAPLYIDDTPGIPIMEFRTKAKRLVKQKGVRLIIVDYLQLMQGPAELRGLREQEVAAISRTLKATAKELNVPIIALSQLSRNAVQRTGGSGKPQLSDLRESGSIEQDADMVIFIHRPDFVGLGEGPEDKEKAILVIAKHRNGEVCDIEMKYKAAQVKFMEMDQSLDIYASQGPVASSVNGSVGEASPLHAQNCLPSIEGNAFKAGERLDYTLQFKWGAVNADVASAVLSLDSVLFRGAPAYHSVITVKSAPFFDFFFKMREKFQGWMTVEGFRPLKFIRDTHEGTYVATNLYYYDWEQNVIHADVNFEGRGKEHYEIPLKPCVYDIGSILYFARNMDTRALVKGGKYPLSFAIDDSVFDVFLTYKGR